MPEAQVVHEDDELRIVTWSRVLANRWRATPSQEKLEALGHHQQSLIDSTTDQKIVVLTILEPQVGMLLSSAARKEAEVLARRGSNSLVALAQVVEGQGFVAAAARAVMSSIQLATRGTYPTNVVSQLDEALTWIAKQLQHGGYEQEAAGVYEALHRSMSPSGEGPGPASS